MPKPIQDSLEKFIINDGQSIKEKESTIINGVIINALWGGGDVNLCSFSVHDRCPFKQKTQNS